MTRISCGTSLLRHDCFTDRDVRTLSSSIRSVDWDLQFLVLQVLSEHG